MKPLILSVVVAVGLSACGGSGGSMPPSGENQTGGSQTPVAVHALVQDMIDSGVDDEAEPLSLNQMELQTEELEDESTL